MYNKRLLCLISRCLSHVPIPRDLVSCQHCGPQSHSHSRCHIPFLYHIS